LAALGRSGESSDSMHCKRSNTSTNKKAMIEQWVDQVEMDENQVPPLTSVSNKALLLAFMLYLDIY